MIDILERLRNAHRCHDIIPYHPVTGFTLTEAKEAADEIESLRSRLAEVDANAPWLTQAHMICTDHGIPQGNISDRLEMLVGYLAEAERDAERLNSRTIRFGNHVYCDVDLRACIDAAREGK